MSTDWDAVVATPFGRVGLRVARGALTELEFLSGDGPLLAPRAAVARLAAQQLARYFDDPAASFDLPLAEQGTPFQRRVWAALRGIPRGQTRTYGDLARELGSAARAVGGACRANPVAIVTPCHRVVAAGGYGGFAGHRGGSLLDIKRWLLAHEGVRLSA